jgi:hypothetical protein
MLFNLPAGNRSKPYGSAEPSRMGKMRHSNEGSQDGVTMVEDTANWSVFLVFSLGMTLLSGCATKQIRCVSSDGTTITYMGPYDYETASAYVHYPSEGVENSYSKGFCHKVEGPR